MEVLKTQGFMDIRSDALDASFADTDVRPRQRLVSAEIDFKQDEIDCARLEFIDPDGRIMQAIRTGEKRNGEEVEHTFWSVLLGYHGQDESKMTTFTGVPQLEFPTFPEDGPMRISIRLFSASTVLKKTTTPKGGTQFWKDSTNTPLMKTLETIAAYYSLPLFMSGEMRSVIEDIDRGLFDQHDELSHLLSLGVPSSYVQGIADSGQSIGDPARLAERWERAKVDVRIANLEEQRAYNLLGTGTNQAGQATTTIVRLETDFEYIKRIAEQITTAIQSDVIPKEYKNARYFNADMPGLAAKSELKVMWGIWNGQFFFSFARDVLTTMGIEGIPVLQYRKGNNMLLSGSLSVQAAEGQGIAAAFTSWLTKKDESTAIDVSETLPEVESPTNPAQDPMVNAWNVEKRIFILSPPDGTISTSIMDADALKRSLDSSLSGQFKAIGLPRLMAGQLIGLDGLWSGALSEAASGEMQQYASYSRLYLVSTVTHRVDISGAYTTAIGVKGCALDGSDDAEISEALMDAMTSTIENSEADSWWRRLGNWVTGG